MSVYQPPKRLDELMKEFFEAQKRAAEPPPVKNDKPQPVKVSHR